MGIRGPAPKPTRLQIIEGNPSHQRLNDLEPQPMVVAPIMPKHLDADARRAWRHLCPILLRVRILTEVDGNALAAYCQVYSTWKQLRDQINKKGVGALLMKTKSGYIQQSPLFTMERDCISQLMVLGRELGLSPSARTRVNMTEHSFGGPMDPFEVALCQ